MPGFKVLKFEISKESVLKFEISELGKLIFQILPNGYKSGRIREDASHSAGDLTSERIVKVSDTARVGSVTMKVKRTAVGFAQACLTLDKRSYSLGYVAGQTFLRATKSNKLLRVLPSYQKVEDGYFVLRTQLTPRPFEGEGGATERRRSSNEVLVPAEYVGEVFSKKTLARFQKACDRLERESDASSLTEVDVLLVSLRRLRGKEVCGRLEWLIRVSNYHRVKHVFDGDGCDYDDAESTSQLIVHEVGEDEKRRRIILNFTAATSEMLQILKSDSFQELVSKRAELKEGAASGISLVESGVSVGESDTTRVVLGSDDDDDDDDDDGEPAAKVAA